MKKMISTIGSLLIAVLTTAVLAAPRPAVAADAAAISRDAHAALNTLYESEDRKSVVEGKGGPP